MIPDVILEFPGGFIRPLIQSDIHSGYIDGLNKEDVNKFLEVRFISQTHQLVEQFISINAASSTSVLWGVWLACSSQHVGTVRIHDINHYHKTAHIGVCLFDRSVWGKGIGRHVIRAVTKWAMQTLLLRWVEAGVYEANLASQRAFISAGYEWVFDIPDKYLLDGKPTTVKVFVARG
jgi:RimJ/RimL family protein N-acetyltransferase